MVIVSLQKAISQCVSWNNMSDLAVVQQQVNSKAKDESSPLLDFSLCVQLFLLPQFLHKCFWYYTIDTFVISF